MATQINGAVVMADGYTFGVTNADGETIECLNYKVAKSISEATGSPIKMRAHYITDWMDAQ